VASYVMGCPSVFLQNGLYKKGRGDVHYGRHMEEVYAIDRPPLARIWQWKKHRAENSSASHLKKRKEPERGYFRRKERQK